MGLAAALGLAGPAAAREVLVDAPMPFPPPAPDYGFGQASNVSGQVMEKVGLPRAAQIALIKSNPHLMQAVVEELKRHNVPDIGFAAIDADLESYKSFSRSAKQRIQFERNLQKAIDNKLSLEPRWYWSVLQKAGIDL
jgi:hypothetical protein